MNFDDVFNGTETKAEEAKNFKSQSNFPYLGEATIVQARVVSSEKAGSVSVNLRLELGSKQYDIEPIFVKSGEKEDSKTAAQRRKFYSLLKICNPGRTDGAKPIVSEIEGRAWVPEKKAFDENVKMPQCQELVGKKILALVTMRQSPKSFYINGYTREMINFKDFKTKEEFDEEIKKPETIKIFDENDLQPKFDLINFADLKTGFTVKEMLDNATEATEINDDHQTSVEKAKNGDYKFHPMKDREANILTLFKKQLTNHGIEFDNTRNAPFKNIPYPGAYDEKRHQDSQGQSSRGATPVKDKGDCPF